MGRGMGRERLSLGPADEGPGGSEQGGLAVVTSEASGARPSGGWRLPSRRGWRESPTSLAIKNSPDTLGPGNPQPEPTALGVPEDLCPLTDGQ